MSAASNILPCGKQVVDPDVAFGAAVLAGVPHEAFRRDDGSYGMRLTEAVAVFLDSQGQFHVFRKPEHTHR
jgi:hypothetical protein